MLLRKIEGIEQHVAYLKGNPSEIETLYQDVLINVTSFFRESGAFGALKRAYSSTLSTKSRLRMLR
jgi:two-component system CheB/CheR fusion protein